MRSILVIVALLIAAGFSGEAEAHSVARSSASRSEMSVAVGMQHVTAATDDVANHKDHEERDCCWDSFCFNPCHCHHCGVTAAVLIEPPASLFEFAGGLGYDALSDSIPDQSLAYDIIDPPRA